jgi:hypothetical protein
MVSVYPRCKIIPSSISLVILIEFLLTSILPHALRTSVRTKFVPFARREILRCKESEIYKTLPARTNIPSATRAQLHSLRLPKHIS